MHMERASIEPTGNKIKHISVQTLPFSDECLLQMLLLLKEARLAGPGRERAVFVVPPSPLESSPHGAPLGFLVLIL